MENRFNYQDLDEEVNIPDLQKTLNKRELWGIIDEEQGGIIAYAIGEENADLICSFMNILVKNNPKR